MRPKARGFTLIEVLIALVLLSLLMGGLLASLRTLGDTATRLEARAAQAEERRLVSGFLRQVVGGLVRKPVDPGDGTPPLPFLGGAAELIWVAPMPAHHTVGGLHRFRLSRADLDEGALRLQFLPYVDDDTPPDWSLADQRLLLEGLQSLEIAYQLAGSRDWRSAWTEADRLPARIRLRLEQEAVWWPELVIPLAGFEAMADRNFGFGF